MEFCGHLKMLRTVLVFAHCASELCVLMREEVARLVLAGVVAKVGEGRGALSSVM